VSARVAAGRLAHIDIGKTVAAPVSGHTLTGELVELTVREEHVQLGIRLNGYTTFTVPVGPHQLVTITGKEAAA
jgi:hypothetical protein